MSSNKVLQLLRTYESRNVSGVGENGCRPIVWRKARGTQVWDEDGRRYLDLTAAFGVAAAGHANSRVVSAGSQQMAVLLHAMGDFHPHARKAELARELSRLTFERWTSSPKSRSQEASKVIFCNSGFEAVEAALKTAMLATGRPGVIAFEGAYHGTGYGALNATHREHFRAPFSSQLGEFGHFVPFPTARNRENNRALESVERCIRAFCRRYRIGALLVEPMQVRGGIQVPPDQFLPRLRRVCDEQNILLILDEIYTGFGRTGRWFACEYSNVVPDLLCLGKALTGGFPLSACLGRASFMDRAWPNSTGEAIHTSTYLGHPVGCAMALAQIAEIRRRRLVARSASLGEKLGRGLARLRPKRPGLRCIARGRGLMWGLELQHADGTPATTEALHCVEAMLCRGFILLPEGPFSNVIGFTPPLTIEAPDLARTLRALQDCLP